MAGVAGVALWVLVQATPEIPMAPLPPDAPSVGEAEELYRASHEALSAGDATALRALTHSRERHRLPRTFQPLPPEDAQQYEFCHVRQALFPTGVDQVLYLVVCEVPGERVEDLFSLRRDRDGAWRIVP
jgi:hypothetical protein